MTEEPCLKTDHLVGAFLFPEAWRDADAFRRLVSKLRDFGINTIITESDAYDANAIAIVHEAGLRFFAGVACFSDHAFDFRKIRERPELWPVLENGERRPQMEWYVGITPTDRIHQQSVLQKIRAIVTDYPVDGLFLDFIRWPLHWEIELRPGQPRPPDSSFDEKTLEQFQELSGLRLPQNATTVGAQAAWIRQNHQRAWVDFKCGVISKFVEETRRVLKEERGTMPLGLFLVPNVDGRTEALTGQRLSELAPLSDLIAPMLYHNILLRPPPWVGEALSEVVNLAGRKSLPVVQADSNRDARVPGDWGPPMTVENWQATLTEVRYSFDNLAGVLVFPGTSLVGNGRGELLRNIFAE
jgi:hypothetical protein